MLFTSMLPNFCWSPVTNGAGAALEPVVTLLRPCPSLWWSWSSDKRSHTTAWHRRLRGRGSELVLVLVLASPASSATWQLQNLSRVSSCSPPASPDNSFSMSVARSTWLYSSSTWWKKFLPVLKWWQEASRMYSHKETSSLVITPSDGVNL